LITPIFPSERHRRSHGAGRFTELAEPARLSILKAFFETMTEADRAGKVALRLLLSEYPG
jgi:hypothetical protein